MSSDLGGGGRGGRGEPCPSGGWGLRTEGRLKPSRAGRVVFVLSGLVSSKQCGGPPPPDTPTAPQVGQRGALNPWQTLGARL